MDSIISAIQEWIKEMLVGGIMSNLSGMFDAVNQQVAEAGRWDYVEPVRDV